MTEPDVTLTDYALFVECALFAWLVARIGVRSSALRRWVVVFFGSTALAAVFGGTVHGFFAGETSGVGRGLWALSMLAIGAAALAGWAIGAHLLLSPERADWVVRAAAIVTAVYAAVILFVNDSFGVAIAGYLPAAIFLFVAFIRVAQRGQFNWARLGAWGLALSFAAAAIQLLRIAPHPTYFNHNALYHLVQAVALALVFVASRRMLESTGGIHAHSA
jgi:hypothetical protein